VIGVMFVLWVLNMLLSLALMTNPQGILIAAIVQLFIFVFFNAVPELIYLGHHSSLDLLGESYTFITENWIEWFSADRAPSGDVPAALRYPPEAGSRSRNGLIALFVYFTMVCAACFSSSFDVDAAKPRLPPGAPVVVPGALLAEK